MHDQAISIKYIRSGVSKIPQGRRERSRRGTHFLVEVLPSWNLAKGRLRVSSGSRALSALQPQIYFHRNKPRPIEIRDYCIAEPQFDLSTPPVTYQRVTKKRVFPKHRQIAFSVFSASGRKNAFIFRQHPKDIRIGKATTAITLTSFYR